jgi:peptide deformylase
MIQLTDTTLYDTLKEVPIDEYKNVFKDTIKVKNWIKSKSAYAVASNQLGFSSKFFVGGKKWKQNKLPTDIFINPSYEGTPSAEKIEEVETCLSYPGQKFKVFRYNEIITKFYDPRDKKTKVVTLTGLASIIYQHETDHLNGRPCSITGVNV